MTDYKKKILKDISKELSEEFDRNFQRKAFFTRKWPARKHLNRKGTLLMVTGELRRSIRCRVDADSVTWETSAPYAAIHNYGGIVYVKPHHRTIHRKDCNGKDKAIRQQVKGYSYKMPRRQFIGDHPQVRKAAEAIINRNLQKAAEDIVKRLKVKL